MKKIILSIGLLLVIAVAGGVFYVLSNLDNLVKVAIEKYGTEATQTSVRVERVRIKLSEGDGAVYNIAVGNPPGFRLKNAVTLGEVGLGIDIKSLGKEPYVINHITVRNSRVFFEINEDKNINLNVLKNNLLSGKKKESSAVSTPESPGKSPRLIINQVTFDKGLIAAKLTPLGKDYELKLPALKMNNIGGNEGVRPKEVTRIILQRLLEAAKNEIKKQGIATEIDNFKAEAKEKLESEKFRLKEEADSKVESEKNKAEDKLKSLLR